MSPEAKSALSSTVRGLRTRLLDDLHDATEAAYRLSVRARDAALSEAAGVRRARLDAWLDEQVRAGATQGRRGRERAHFLREVEKRAAYTLLNRLVLLRLLEGMGLRKVPVLTGGWESEGYRHLREIARVLVRDDPSEGYAYLLQLIFEDLALELPGLYGPADLADLIPVGAATLRRVVEALDAPGLATCWTDDMTLGWVYQYWNDPEREALDAKLHAGGKVEPHEIASKTQMFTERYMVDWLLQNSLGPLWLAMCRKHGWTPDCERLLPGEPEPAPAEPADCSGSHAPAWEQVPTLQRRVGPQAAGAAKTAFPRGAWEREDAAADPDTAVPVGAGFKPAPTGLLRALDERRADWRARRERGEVALTDLIPLHTEAERRWAYYVPQPIPADAVAHAPDSVRDLKILDPAVGSGHFLVVAFDLLLALYREEARHRGEEGAEPWSERACVERILTHNLHGIDLDPRAVQIAAAALWLKARRTCPEARPARLNLVASNLRLGALPDTDPALIELRREVERETGIPAALTDTLIHALAGADHLGSLLKVDAALEEAIERHETVPKQLTLFGDGFMANTGSGNADRGTRQASRADTKADILGRLEGFLAHHTGGEDLGLRLHGEQLAAGVRFVRMLREGQYDLVVGNPPYQGTSKMADAEYVKRHYPLGKADLYAAFLIRGLQLAREGGTSALLTMRNWMFIKQYAEVRESILGNYSLRTIADLGTGAFSSRSMDDVISSAMAVIRRANEKTSPASSISVRAAPLADPARDSSKPAKRHAALLCQQEQFNFHAQQFIAVADQPILYWWSNEEIQFYKNATLMGAASPAYVGASTGDNVRFTRFTWELAISVQAISRLQDLDIKNQVGTLSDVLSESVSDDGHSLSNAVAESSSSCSSCPSWFEYSYHEGHEGRVERIAWHDSVRITRHMWLPFINGAKGRVWIEPLLEVISWECFGLSYRVSCEVRIGANFRSPEKQGRSGVAFAMIGSYPAARLHRFLSIFGDKGSSVFPGNRAEMVCSMNATRARDTLQSLNPSMSFQVGDVNRLPVFAIGGSAKICATLNQAFSDHESHREPSIEFKHPGPSPWRHAQAWAQVAVDRPEGAPLPPYEPEYDPEPPTDHLSFALGVALGRFGGGEGRGGEGILDPATADLAHALPGGILFLDGTLDANDRQDGLGHPAAEPLHAAWAAHGAAVDPKSDLRTWLRLKCFKDVHRAMYENRPIHWPLSSDKRTFVAWITIHRWDADTLRLLQADHLNEARKRIEGELADLRAARDGADRRAADAAEKRYDRVLRWRDELAAFITLVEQCAERGAPPADAKCPARERDARYQPDLDDGVMINSAALWPLLEPQWKDPRKWWKELASAAGKKDYDWSHLAMRYWPTRVDAKCRQDPSLGVAHGCFWAYHPARAWAWELRLQDEIAAGSETGFRIEEGPYRDAPADSAAHRAAYLAEHSEEALAAVAKETLRRRRKRKAPQPELHLLEPGLWTDHPAACWTLELAIIDKQGADFHLRAPDEPEARAAFEQANPPLIAERAALLLSLVPRDDLLTAVEPDEEAGGEDDETDTADSEDES